MQLAAGQWARTTKRPLFQEVSREWMDRMAEVGSAPLAVGLEDPNGVCAVPTRPPLVVSPNSWPPEGSHIRPQTAGEGALGVRFPLFSAPDLPRLGGVALSQTHPSEPQKSFPL